MRKSSIAGLGEVREVGDTVNRWTCLLLPGEEPYKEGAFQIQVDFPEEYPFKPPTVQFLTKIFHPNVDNEGKMCFAMISVDKWKPVTRIVEVVEALLKIMTEPDMHEPSNGDAATLLAGDREQFLRQALTFTREHALQRTDSPASDK